MLINISNHPSKHWTEGQLQAALKQYGKIKDLPRPYIPPDISTDKILREHVLPLIAECNELFGAEARRNPDSDDGSAIHLMGETTFVVQFALAWNAQDGGCGVHEPLVCSTTHRVVDALPDGSKRSHFEFVQFRMIDY